MVGWDSATADPAHSSLLTTLTTTYPPHIINITLCTACSNIGWQWSGSAAAHARILWGLVVPVEGRGVAVHGCFLCRSYRRDLARET